jgi:hypothetical protein
MDKLKRRSFFGSLFAGSAAAMVAVETAKSEVRDLDGKMALAELNPDCEYILFADPTRVDLDSLVESFVSPMEFLPNGYEAVPGPNLHLEKSRPDIRVVPTFARPGMPVSTNVALYALDSKRRKSQDPQG